MTPEDREKLVQALRMLGQGRCNYADVIVDLLVPPQLQTEEVLTMSVDELIKKLDKPAEAETVEIVTSDGQVHSAPEAPPKGKPGPKPKQKP